ncbi:hypothetical protein K1T71_000672 [Dendrolimus kikuchii]|uniref:Uncharacterized protein n=1 Tax=Dendrolimus kikuchii TaxID=765133 RepID=A0ACC1DJU9_9NEOP|nr:hypothetical protein K1T71_000672 [Dendrolimus kikuchii]
MALTTYTGTDTIKVGEYLTCYICKKDIPQAYTKEHLASVIHKCNADLICISLERSRNMVKEKVPFVQRELINGKYCDLCNCNYEDPYEHFDSDKHCKLRTLEDIMPNICALFKDAENNLNALDNILQCLQMNLKGKDTTINKSKTYCDICKVYKNSQGFAGHTQCRKHLLKCLANDIPIPVIDDKTFCDVCIVYKNTKNYDEHLNSAVHKTRKSRDRNFLINGHDIKYMECMFYLKKHCKICKIVVDDDINEVNLHINGVGHIFKYINILNENDITKFVNEYFCPKCEMFFDDIVKHLNSNSHLHLLILDSDKTFCELCKVKLSLKDFAGHEKAKRHIRKQSKFVSNANINYIDFNLEELDINKKGMITVKDKILKCKVCDETLTDILNHLEQHDHHEDTEQ